MTASASPATQALSAQARERLHRRTLKVVLASQVLGGAGLAAGVTTGGLIARDMLGSAALAGAPVALFTLGSAVAALLVGMLSQQYGRRVGLVSGYAAGAAGAVGVVAATAADSVLLFFAALLVYGSGVATNLQARYAGTDLAPPTSRATSVSIIMVATTLGAVVGPNLTSPMANVARRLEIPELAGVFMLAAVVYASAALILHLLLRPDPYLAAQALLRERSADVAIDTGTSNLPGLVSGAAVMVLIQMIMVGIMTMTPIHMQHHGHDLGAVGLVIGAHIGSMYLPSLLTGVLVDRLGRFRMAAAAGITLCIAGIVAAAAPPASVVTMLVALALLGIGWNFGLISGTALIADSAAPAHRARIQGRVDLLVALAGSAGGAGAGVIAASSSFAALSLIGGTFALTIIVVAWVARRPQQLAAADA